MGKSISLERFRGVVIDPKQHVVFLMGAECTDGGVCCSGGVWSSRGVCGSSMGWYWFRVVGPWIVSCSFWTRTSSGSEWTRTSSGSN